VELVVKGNECIRVEAPKFRYSGVNGHSFMKEGIPRINRNEPDLFQVNRN
jgi:hypothetical protein